MKTAQSNNGPVAFGDFQEGELLRGAKPIAVFLFNGEKRFTEVYRLADGGALPIFRMQGKLTARTTSLARAIVEKERRAIEAQRAKHDGTSDQDLATTA